jgi:hypothetical protein
MSVVSIVAAMKSPTREQNRPPRWRVRFMVGAAVS